MKYAFISDIHGNAVALEAVLQDIEDQNVDEIVVLGDLCYRGPQPKESLQLIRSLDSKVVKGNADEWVVRGVHKGEVPDDALEMMNIEREWTLSKLDDLDISYLEKLPHGLSLQAEDKTIQVFHATADSLFDIVLPDADNETITKKMMKADGQVYVYGHIHNPFIRSIDGKMLINTGSVGLPFDGLPKASYAIVEIESGKLRASIERVDFDIEKAAALYSEKGYPNAEQLISFVRNGKR
ncbi:metallophosphoesterase family protein [Bacillus dakarensis]|uniref:metallophosphoesterase family protein n=1 Tax=Robertmurraya dakarensis TaxID=1926278 RepID=UPI00098180D6|nr:metallophosphoesterase family protein [Bacillus dakarensis]